MEPHLYLKRGKKNILLVRYFDKFHFIELDHRMHRKVKAWFLDAPRTEEEMDEKGLVRTTHALKDIRGVAAVGTGRGQVVQFYLQEGKRRYELAEDCELTDMSALFDGLESFAPPQRDSKWQDPRLARQDPKLRRLLWPVGILLNIAGFVSGFLIWAGGFEIRWLSWISLFCVPVSLTLYCLYPDYFNIFPEKRKYGQKKGTRSLLSPLACSAGMIMGAVSCYEVNGLWKAWAIGAAAVAALAVVLYMTAPVFRDGDKIAMLVLAGVLLSGGPVLALNNLLDAAPPQEIQTEVVDKEKHTGSKSPDIYELIVILEGEEREIPVGGETYAETEIGDAVTVELHKGAFSIPYMLIP